MDRKYIDDNHIAARYLAGQLSDTEREAFESYFVEQPEMMRELEVAARLKVGLMDLHDAGELAPLVNRPARVPRALQFAAAAAVVVAVVGISIFYMRGASAPAMLAASAEAFVDDRGTPLPVASSLALLRARSSGYDAEINPTASAATTELRVRTEFEADPPRYRVTLSSLGDGGEAKLVAEVAHLTATEDGFVHVFLNGVRRPGMYSLVLSGDEGTSAAGQARTFLIRIH